MQPRHGRLAQPLRAQESGLIPARILAPPVSACLPPRSVLNRPQTAFATEIKPRHNIRHPRNGWDSAFPTSISPLSPRCFVAEEFFDPSREQARGIVDPDRYGRQHGVCCRDRQELGSRVLPGVVDQNDGKRSLLFCLSLSSRSAVKAYFKDRPLSPSRPSRSLRPLYLTGER